MIFLKIFWKRFSILTEFAFLHKLDFPLRFSVGCCLSFQRLMCKHVFHIQITGSVFSSREQNSAKRYHPSEKDKLCTKSLPFLILIISSPYLQWVSKVCMQRGVLLMLPFRQLSNLVNNIHERALKLTYDDEDSKLNDIALPNMKAYYHSLKSCFVLSMFFCDI